MGDQLSSLTSIDTQNLNRHFMPLPVLVSQKREEFCLYLVEGFFTVGWQAKAQHSPQRCWQWAESGGKGLVKCNCEGLCFLLFRLFFMSCLISFISFSLSLTCSLALIRASSNLIMALVPYWGSRWKEAGEVLIGTRFWPGERSPGRVWKTRTGPSLSRGGGGQAWGPPALQSLTSQGPFTCSQLERIGNWQPRPGMEGK